MNEDQFYTVQSQGFGLMWRLQMTLGLLLLLFGVLVAAFPQILVVLVAATFCMIGLGLMGSAWRLRRAQQNPVHRRFDEPIDF
jgi:uncharacterized membrane protein YqjE